MEQIIAHLFGDYILQTHMIFDLLSLEINKHSETYINIFCIGKGYKTKSLFYAQWGYNKKLTRLQILFIQVK